MISHGGGAPKPRDDVPLGPNERPATGKPAVDPPGKLSAADQRMLERRRAGHPFGGTAFRRHG